MRTTDLDPEPHSSGRGQAVATRSGSPSGVDDAFLADAIRAAQHGSEAAWRLLHDRYLAIIRTLVRRHAGRQLLLREEPDDLVALVLLKLVRALPKLTYRSEPEFLGWLATLALRTIAARANHHRAHKRRGTLIPLQSSTGEKGLCAASLSGPSEDPLYEAQWRDELAALGRLVRDLGPKERDFMRLVLEHDGDTRAIGAELGITGDAARMRWLYLRRKLRALSTRRLRAA